MTAWRKSTWSALSECVEAGEDWRKSTRCQAGECAEAGNGPTGILVRDTADRDGTVLSFTPGAWAEFTAGITGGAR